MKKIIIFPILLFFSLLLVPKTSAGYCTLETGHAYKSVNDPAVYYITDQCTKRPFNNSNLFFSYFNSWDEVETVFDNKLDTIDLDSLGFMPWGPKYDPQYGALVKTVNDSKVYLLLGGEKYWITSEEVFNSLNYSWNWIEDVDKRLLDKYTLGFEINYTDHHPNYTLVKYANNPKVYRLEPSPIHSDQQIKVYIKNEQEFENLGFRWDRIVTITQDEQYTEKGSSISKCGNGVVDSGEECDGGSYCSSSCLITSQYQNIPFVTEDGYVDYILEIDDKLAIDDQLNIRIDSIEKDISEISGSMVSYSIWGRDNGNICRLISTTGMFWTKDNDYKFREFTNAFVELIDVASDSVTLRVYTGNTARQRCEEISGWKKDIACSFYPTNNSYYIQNDKFRIYLTPEFDKDYAHYIIDALRNCYDKIVDIVPAVHNLSSFGERWTVYPMISGGGAFSADYQRISIGSEKPSYINSFPNLFAEIQGNRCPMEKAYIPHELTHLLFAETMLQDMYDGANKAEIGSNEPGSMRLSEGLAEFLPYYISKDDSSSATENYRINKNVVCGENSLINHNNKYGGATTDQLKYSEIFAGRGYGSNHYDAGFCFFKRIEDECGESAIDDLFEKQILYSGRIIPQPTVFSMLSNICGQAKIKDVMSDYGFSHELLEVTQQNPRDGFVDGLNKLGCL